MEDRIRRIREMEGRLNSAINAVKKLDDAIESFIAAAPEIEELISYYESELWISDFDADCNGELPDDLKRGVLSEDGIYDLLSDYQRLKALIKEKDETE